MDQGNVNLKLNFKSLQARTAGFSGEVRTDGFDLGSLLQVPKLGRFTLSAGVTGSYGGRHAQTQDESRPAAHLL